MSLPRVLVFEGRVVMPGGEYWIGPEQQERAPQQGDIVYLGAALDSFFIASVVAMSVEGVSGWRVNLGTHGPQVKTQEEYDRLRDSGTPAKLTADYFVGFEEMPGYATIFGARTLPRSPQVGDPVSVRGEIRTITEIAREVVPCAKAPEGAWVVACRAEPPSLAEMREAGDPIPDFEHHCKPDETGGRLADIALPVSGFFVGRDPKKPPEIGSLVHSTKGAPQPIEEVLDFHKQYGWEVRLGEPVADPEDDPVDHPAHYQLPGGIEVIQITRHLNFNIGNAVKYLLRAGHKGDAVEDLRKALWYIQDEIKMEQNADSPF